MKGPGDRLGLREKELIPRPTEIVTNEETHNLSGHPSRITAARQAVFTSDNAKVCLLHKLIWLHFWAAIAQAPKLQGKVPCKRLS